MIINQEQIRRMVEGGGGSQSVSGAGSSTGGVSPGYIEANYISKAFFSELFEAHIKTTVVVTDDGGEEISRTVTDGTLSPNDLPGVTEETDSETGYTTTTTVTIISIEAKYGLWTNFFLSALGLGSGSGGETVLTEPLASINTAGLGAPTAAQNGMTIVWDSTLNNGAGGWKYGVAGGGGLSDQTTFWGQTAANGAVSGNLTGVGDVITGSLGGNLVGMHCIELNNFGSLANYGGFIDFHFNGSSADYTTRLIEDESGVLHLLGNLKIGGSSAIRWDSQASMLRGVVTSVGLSVPTGFTVSGSPVTDQGTLTIGFASGYTLPETADVEKGITAYGWGDHSQAGYWDSDSHPTTLSGYGITDAYSKTDADAKFMTIAAFENLFNAMNSYGQKVSHPYSSAVASIKAMVGLYTDQFLSALGLGSGGSGGATSLSDLVDVSITSPANGDALVYNANTMKWTNASITGSSTLAGLTDVSISNPTDGQVLKYNGTTGLWYNGTDSGGGGGISINDVWNALAASTSEQINSSHLSTALSGYLPTTGGTVTGTIFLGTGTYTDCSIKENSSNRVLQFNGDRGITFITGTGYDLKWGTSTIATQSWVNDQGFLTQHQTVSGTFWGQSWSNGGTVFGNIIDTYNIKPKLSGYYDLGSNDLRYNNGYINALYARQYLYFRNNSTPMSGLYIEGWNLSNVATIGWHTSYSSVKQYIQMYYENANYGNEVYIPNGRLAIGNGVLMWDSANNALKVMKRDGTVANLYATGGLGALGFQPQTGGSATVGDLNVTGSAQFGANVGVVGSITAGGDQIITGDLYLDAIDTQNYGGKLYVWTGHLYFYNGTTTYQLA